MSLKMGMLMGLALSCLSATVVPAVAKDFVIDLTSHNFNDIKKGDEHKHFDIGLDETIVIRGRPLEVNGRAIWPQLEGTKNINVLTGFYDKEQKLQGIEVGPGLARYFCRRDNIDFGGNVYLDFNVLATGSAVTNRIASAPQVKSNREFMIDLRSHDFNSDKSGDETRHYKVALDETVVIKGNPFKHDELVFWPRVESEGNVDVLSNWEDHVQKLKLIAVGKGAARYWCETGMGPCGGIIRLKFDVVPAGTIIQKR